MGGSKPDPSGVEGRFAGMLADASRVFTEKSSEDLVDFMNPPMKTVDDLREQLRIYNNGFSAFRAKRQAIFEAVGAALRPVEAVGEIAAGAASTAYPPSQNIFAAALKLIASARNVSATYDSVIELFEQLKEFTSRLDVYLRYPISDPLRAQIVAILAALFEVLVLTTKEIRRGRIVSYLNRLLGSESRIQPALNKLKALTLGEERQVLADTFGNLSELSTKAGQIEDAVSQVNQGVQSLRVEHGELFLANRDKLRDILDPSPFPEDIYNAFKKSTVPNTGDWILEDEGLNTWLQGQVPFLWIFGNAGTGKSHLTARILTWVLDDARLSPSAAYFFFRANNAETRSITQALRDAAYQLSEKDIAYRKFLMSRLESRDEIRTVASAFRELFTSPAADGLGASNRSYFIFLDGIDEANPDEVSELLDSLTPSEAEEEPACMPLFRFALVGRSYLSEKITSTLDPMSAGQTLSSVQVTTHRNQLDVNAFIENSVLHSKVLSRTPVDFKAKVIEAVEKQADGLFILARILLDDVNRKSHQTSILQSLRKFPKEINGVLSQTLLRLSTTISEESARDLNEMLRWVTCAEEPLTLGQLAAVLAMSFGDAPLFLEESLRRQYSCFFDLEREDGQTTDDLVKEFDARRDISPARRLTSPHIRSFSAGEATAPPPRRISPAGRGSLSRHSSPMGGLSTPQRRPSPASPNLAVDGFDTASDTEFRSNWSTTRVTFFHSAVREFFRERSRVAPGASAVGRPTVGFDIQDARVRILMTCLRVFLEKDWFMRVELGPGKEATKQYAAWYWQEHAMSIDLASTSRDDKREIGVKLYEMLTNESVLFDWSIMYAKNDEGLEVLTDGSIKCLQTWFQDPDVVSGLSAQGQAFAKSSASKAASICEPMGRLYAKAWLSSDFEPYAPTLFCFKIVQNVALVESGYEWSYSSLHWPDMSVEDRVARATKWAGQPTTTHFHRRLGSTFLTLKLHKEALRHYDEALKMDKNSIETCSRIAYCLYQDGRYHDAREQALECAAMEERDIREAGRRATLKNVRWRLYRDYLLVAQCSYPIGDMALTHEYYRKAIDSAGVAELEASESLEAETGYLEVLAAENLHSEVMQLAKEMSVQPTRNDHGQSRFVDLLLEQHNTLLVLDWIPKAASKTDQLEFLLERLGQAIMIAEDRSDTLRFLYLRLALGTAYADNRELDEAIAVLEQSSLLAARPRGTISTRQAHAVAFQKLAALYKQKALHAGLGTAAAEGWMNKLEAVEKTQERHQNPDMPINMLGSDVNVASIYLACFYRRLGKVAEARSLLRGLIRDSLVILSDSSPQNDVFALDNLLRIFIAAGDDDNAKALARSMRKVNPEASMSTPGDSPLDQRLGPKLPGIQAYDRSCFQCFNNVSASKDFAVCRLCMECYCTACLNKVIRRPGNSTEDSNGEIVCRSDHEWFIVEPLNRILHSGEIQFEDDRVQDLAEWKAELSKTWGLNPGFYSLIEGGGRTRTMPRSP